jgi:hypothetical protein
MQKEASIVIDNRQARTLRLNQSTTYESGASMPESFTSIRSTMKTWSLSTRTATTAWLLGRSPALKWA